ncbi:MAG: efflux RND transporter periplasmic adaptor subunit [Thermoanaerobaculia bacterium]
MKKIFLILFLSFSIIFGISCKKELKEDIKYHCPMHPTYISNKPGDCPICGMKLVPIEREEKIQYTCPMHPEVISEKEGKCPKCGMDLVPVEKNKEQKVSSLGEVKTKENVLAASGIEKEKAYKGKLSSIIKTVGYVLPDERRVKTYYTKVSGWIEKLYLNFEGQYIEKGQPILSIYSQELYSAQSEFLSAKKAYEESKSSEFEVFRKSTKILYENSKRKLLLLDVPDDFIEKLEKEGEIQKNITLYSPFSGFVIGKDVYEGKKIESGMELFKIADLSVVWIEGSVYEAVAPFISLKQRSIIELPFDPSYKKEVELSYIYPYINEDTRTIKVRLEVENKDLKLMPNMYVDLKIKLKEEEGIIIPSSAIIDTGLKKIVFVEMGENNFVGREIEVSLIEDEKTIIKSGLKEGEVVASRGLFLLDSEARIGAAISHQH